MPSATMPAHVAIIMDGNGRWAEQQHKPRAFGHKQGGKTARKIIDAASDHGLAALSLFAFSSENWARPRAEVDVLMSLFSSTLERELDELHARHIKLTFPGDRSRFSERLLKRMETAEQATADNTGMILNLAVSYGGRWDIVSAVQKLAAQGVDLQQLDEATLSNALSLAGQPEPDLMIRTGGESRMSNFLLWNLAYSELYFSPQLWPDFGVESLHNAMQWFADRERRFGQTTAQLVSG